MVLCCVAIRLCPGPGVEGLAFDGLTMLVHIDRRGEWAASELCPRRGDNRRIGQNKGALWCGVPGRGRMLAIADPSAKTTGIGDLGLCGGIDTGSIGRLGSAFADFALKTRTRNKNHISSERAAHRAGACFVAVVIAQIAFFLRCLFDLITASRAKGACNRLTAHVEPLLVEFSVVARLFSQENKPITAGCFYAPIEAETIVVVDVFAKVTLFILALLEKTIAAAGLCAERCTELCITIIGAQIALFAAFDDVISAEGLIFGV